MVWFYIRNHQSLAIETRYDNSSSEFVGTVRNPGGPSVTKRFSTAAAFREWLQTVDRDLVTDQWAPDGTPRILQDGWRDKPWSSHREPHS
jgi:hypothetical protein